MRWPIGHAKCLDEEQAHGGPLNSGGYMGCRNSCTKHQMEQANTMGAISTGICIVFFGTGMVVLFKLV
ncbi:hypothetical protein TWF225_007300 [Orbilia oligospora]|uniref:Uncharacterized protein n=1 Tax=Orbilia oligospora TaxID=2813651 RepID=A0A8H2E503_ORBOL|nr:hypothetical protein TWF225_007300 [Orbilia oligospora]KAF3241777.1 hypothetical protein TWF217_011948 [Orbilia oligospora]TGJ71509.1 hypothetical protein EYR41_003471 [Orbilia oligospora]